MDETFDLEISLFEAKCLISAINSSCLPEKRTLRRILQILTKKLEENEKENLH